MANTDFFDDDLANRDASRRSAADEEVEAPGGSGDLPARPISDLNISRMARHRNEVDSQVATAMQELERLKKRQEDLEREKKGLEELRQRQSEYERGKREMIERFHQSLVHLEREEAQAERMAELLSVTRKRFREMLGEIESLREEIWPDDRLRDELSQALVVLDDARLEYNKAMAKIDAVQGAVGETPVEHKPVMFDSASPAFEEEKTFGYWLKAGFGFTLPLIVTLVVLALVYLALQSAGWF